MYKVLIFAGTTEGIILCNLLASNKIPAYACVATEYGTLSYEKSEFLTVQAKRLTAEEMQTLMCEINPEIVLDATHPYAAEVTQNIKTACKNTGFFYQRVLRGEGDHSDSAIYVESTEAVIEFLKQTEGNILVKLMDISLTPNQTLGRMLYSFSATAYEIDEESDWLIVDRQTL